MVARYTPWLRRGAQREETLVTMKPDGQGAWVAWEDYRRLAAAAAAEQDRLQAHIADLRDQLDHMVEIS